MSSMLDGTTRTPHRIEWPTLVAIGAWLLALTAVVVGHRSIPWYLSVPALALLSAFHFSLQHEAIHGHPTPWRTLNTALVGIPLSLWCPYEEYRRSHLQHHASQLTVPGVDPESYHVTGDTWRRSGPLMRRVLLANRTLAGRLLLGPWMAIARSFRGAAAGRRLPAVRRTWLAHVPIAVATVVVIVGLAGLPAWEYLVGVVWGGTALTMLRSFAEHRDTGGAGTPSAVVRSNPLMSLLFLNNNLHHAHHARPGAAWYRLPALRRELGSDELARRGAGWYRGYAEVAARYLFRPFGEPVHPSERDAALAVSRSR